MKSITEQPGRLSNTTSISQRLLFWSWKSICVFLLNQFIYLFLPLFFSSSKNCWRTRYSMWSPWWMTTLKQNNKIHSLLLSKNWNITFPPTCPWSWQWFKVTETNMNIKSSIEIIILQYINSRVTLHSIPLNFDMNNKRLFARQKKYQSSATALTFML